MIAYPWAFIISILFLAAPIWAPLVLAAWHRLIDALESLHD